MARRSAPFASRCVANECRSACGLMPNFAPHSGDITPHEPIDAARSRAPAAIVEEERRLRASRVPCVFCPLPSALVPCRASIFQPGAQRVRRARVERHQPLLPPLAQHAHHPARQVHILHVQADQLAQPKPRRVEQLENGAVAAAERRRRVRHLEQPVHLVDRQVRGNRLAASSARRRAKTDRPR